MNLLDHFVPGNVEMQVRPPDHVEQRNGLFLQVWGHEGYWHVVDEEFRDLLQEAARRTSLEAILKRHADWRPHRRSIEAQLRRMSKAGLMGEAAKPTPAAKIENLTVNLTTACNLCCRTCYVPQEVRTPTKLDIEDLLRFLVQLRPRLSEQATLSLLGGEPFLHPEGVLAIGRWATRNGLVCNVSTNGTVLSADLLAGLVDANLKVQVSLDGASARTNDLIRGEGTFEKALCTVRRLVTGGVPTTLSMVCCLENLTDIPDYFRLGRNLGVEQVRFIPLKKIGQGNAGAVTPAPQLDIVQAICRELDAEPANAAMCQSDLYSIVRSMLRESSQRRSCGSGTQTLLVQADGRVYPCINTTASDLNLGHISDGAESLLTCGREFGKTLAVDSPAHPCYGCHVKRWCLAGCPGETFQQEGKLARHWNCLDLQRTISFVMWRLANEQKSKDNRAARTWI